MKLEDFPMNGRIAVKQYLPYLSVLSKHGAARPEDIQRLVRECMTIRTLSKHDVLSRLYCLDIAAEKQNVFSAVVSSIENLREEKVYAEEQ